MFPFQPMVTSFIVHPYIFTIYTTLRDHFICYIATIASNKKIVKTISLNDCLKLSIISVSVRTFTIVELFCVFFGFEYLWFKKRLRMRAHIYIRNCLVSIDSYKLLLLHDLWYVPMFLFPSLCTCFTHILIGILLANLSYNCPIHTHIHYAGC